MSAVTNIALSGIFPNLQDLLMKSPVFNIKLTFSVGTPQFEMIVITDTFDSCLWILESRYNSPRLHVFLNSKWKYFNSFLVINCMCLKLSNNLLHFPVKLGIKINIFLNCFVIKLLFCFHYIFTLIPNHNPRPFASCLYGNITIIVQTMY